MRRETIVYLTIVMALVCIGIFIIYSASAVETHPTSRLIRQLINVGLGGLALVLATQFNYHRFKDPILFRAVVLFAVTLLVLVLIPGIGVVRGGAQRWIEVLGFSFQPSELGKFAIILLLAVKLTENQDKVGQFWQGLVPPLVVTGFIAGLIVLERDLGTPVVIAAVAFIMLIVAGAKWRYLLPTVIPAVAAVGALIATSPHRVQRIISFLDPWAYRDDEGYQLIQSLAAFARGSLWGRGPGAGEQKLYYLPEAHTDFIFAVWGEEMGLVGTLTLVALFAALVFLGARIAWRASDLFGMLLASGIVSLVAIQSVVNMMVTTGMMPTKGLPLPFISWGGSSLIVFMGLMGIVINIGLQAEPKPKRLASSPATAA